MRGVKVSGIPAQPLGKTSMDGERKRAPMGVVKASDIPA